MKHIKLPVFLLITIFGISFTINYRHPSHVRSYINSYSSLAQENMKTYHIPASIIMGQALLESDAGRSELAKNANNHFGIKCRNDWDGETYEKWDDDETISCFRKYNTPEGSFRDHSDFITKSSNYDMLFTFEKEDYTSWAYGLQKCGYATNTEYAKLLIDIIEKYKLYEFDQPMLVSEAKPVAEEKPVPLSIKKFELPSDYKRGSYLKQ